MRKHSRQDSSFWPMLALRVVLISFICVGLALGGWVGWFYVHSKTGGTGLLTQARQRIAAGTHSANTTADCTPVTGAVGELVIPSLSLVAPVVQGDGDAQLADAVGHVPTSVWPGEGGATVFAAHDVTWFHDLGQLKPDANIEYVSGCKAVTYAVKSIQVVTQGTAVTNAPGTLALVTCWPLNALWFTGQRLLVEANEVGGATNAPAISVVRSPPLPTLAIPTALASVDTLATNPTPLGALTISGTPATTYPESPGPLADAAAAQGVYFAALRSAESKDANEWAIVAPHVRKGTAAPLGGTNISNYTRPVETVLKVKGDKLTGATLGAAIDITNNGEWKVTVTEGLVDGKLAVIGWTMFPM